jgi:hypothetical protein
LAFFAAGAEEPAASPSPSLSRTIGEALRFPERVEDAARSCDGAFTGDALKNAEIVACWVALFGDAVGAIFRLFQNQEVCSVLRAWDMKMGTAQDALDDVG